MHYNILVREMCGWGVVKWYQLFLYLCSSYGGHFVINLKARSMTSILEPCWGLYESWWSKFTSLLHWCLACSPIRAMSILYTLTLQISYRLDSSKDYSEENTLLGTYIHELINCAEPRPAHWVTLCSTFLAQRCGSSILCGSAVYFVLLLYCSSSSPVPGHRDCKEQIRTQFSSFPPITSGAVTVLNVFIHNVCSCCVHWCNVFVLQYAFRFHKPSLWSFAAHSLMM